MQRKYLKFYLISLLVPTFVLFGRLYSGNFDFSYFIVAGDKIVNPNIHPYPIRINENSYGYDGQFFYHLAINPFTKSNYEYGIQNDLKYRKQRIFYPLLAYFMSIGNPNLTPYTLVAVNLLALFVMFYFIALFLQEKLASPNSILVFAFFSGSYISLSRDLCEAVEGCFIVCSLYFFYKEKLLPFIICATAALLTREVSFLIIFPGTLIYAWHLIRNKTLIYKFPLVFLPLLIFAFWKLYLYYTHGLSGGGLNFTFIPFQGLVKGLTTIYEGNLHPTKYSHIYHIFYGIYCSFYLAWFFGTFLTLAPRIKFNETNIKLWMNISWLIWMIFLLFFSDAIYNSELSFGRVLSSFSIVCFIMHLFYEIKLSKLYILYTISIGFSVIFRIIIFV
jgi:hypothetical protein